MTAVGSAELRNRLYEAYATQRAGFGGDEALAPGGVFVSRVPSAISPLSRHIRNGDFTHQTFAARKGVSPTESSTMCGIAGVIDPVAERAAARVHLLNEAQTHRGPDHAAVTRASVITLGNTRLAIRDLTPAGNQPFVSADGRYVCVFNGEIYNHRQLAERFLLPVRTACDGEVIPHLWSKLGMESLAELRGMFAIALADVLKERLYLARDPFGIKPLYWRLLSDGSLAFASEVRPLARLAPGTRVDDAAVARFSCASGRWPPTRARSRRSPPSRPTASQSLARTGGSRFGRYGPAALRRSAHCPPIWA